MYAWSTPTLALRVKNVDLTAYECHVTIEQPKVYGGTTEVDVSGADLTVALDGDDTTIALTLTQAQAGAFERGPASVQVNAIDSGGTRVVTQEVAVMVHRNLLDHAISYGGA